MLFHLKEEDFKKFIDDMSKKKKRKMLNKV